jgi:hypothetical protein
VTITASYQGASRATVMTITNVAALESVSLTPSTFKGGTSANGSVALTKFAPPGGITVSLSDTLSVFSTPTSVRVGSGAKLQSFVATSTPVTSTAVGTLIATANGVTRTITVTLTP